MNITAYTYIVKCKDNSYYCGWTNDINKRVAKHNSGKGAKYTRSRRPVELIYIESFDTGLNRKENKILAMKREYIIKQLTKKQKIELVNTYNV